MPARYGGFETAAEEIGWRLARDGHSVVVYSRGRSLRSADYRGMKSINLPAIRRKSLETISHTLASVLHIAAFRRHRPDVALVFNSANAPFIPLLKTMGIPVAINVDGLEWKRAKWSGIAARYYRWAEKSAVNTADSVISDAQGIADHILQTHGRTSTVIPYGAPIISPELVRLSEIGLARDQYHLVVARFEPENHVLEVVRGFALSRAKLPLILVGDAPYADDYVDRVRQIVGQDPRIRMLGSVWDQELLDDLYAGARSYIHGHSVGGTNPSLLRALGAGAPVTAFDVNFNREVSGGHALFFESPNQLALCVESDDHRRDSSRSQAGRRHVRKHYQWEDVAQRYLRLCESLAPTQPH